jgi:hypothetical protein
MRQDTTKAARKQGGCAQASPALDPALLRFDHQATYLRAGHLYLVATYPSWSRKGTLHRVIVRDDGQAVDCTCTGWNLVGKCYHLTNAAEIAREYRRRDLRALAKADLLREDSWYAHVPADSLDEAQRLVLDALGNVVAEHYAASDRALGHGRGEVAS